MSKVKVDGVAMYASVHTPNQHTGVFSVDLIVDDATSKKLQAVGLSPAKDKTGAKRSYEDVGHAGDVFRFKRKLQTASGTKLSPPKVVDSVGNDIPSNILIGNGSKVRVYGTAYEYNAPGKGKGIAAGLNTLQVIDLVKVEFIDRVDGGFTVDASAAPTPKDLSEDEDVF